MRVGLIGYGKAGQAVASVLQQDKRFDLRWAARRQAGCDTLPASESALPLVGLSDAFQDVWLDAHPVDGIIDFSAPEAIRAYGPVAAERGIAIVSAISAYTDEDLAFARGLATSTRVLCSPNITLGINFMIMAARLLRHIAPEADVEIIEQHFRDKPEVSGTARKLARSLDLPDERITSLRLGGIVGHHEVIFGFPYQTVRIGHDSIRREAFGTGAAFAMRELLKQAGPGFHTFDDLLMTRLEQTLQQA